jgi:hypothetical protein
MQYLQPLRTPVGAETNKVNFSLSFPISSEEQKNILLAEVISRE